MEIGDRVRIKEDLKIRHYYGGATFTEEMIEFLGKEAMIIEKLSKYSYGLDIDLKEDFEFTDEMLEFIE